MYVKLIVMRPSLERKSMSEFQEKHVSENWPDDLVPGYQLSSYLRGCNSTSIGELLTLLEVAIPAGSQLDALKEVVKHEMWRLANISQDSVYTYIDELGLEEMRKLEILSEKKKIASQSLPKLN